VEAIKNIGDVTCNLTQQFGFFTDIKKSKGNFVADIDGNLYLDLF
jgi:4-aminobutyrate aminotransferase-like enzyme